MKSDELVRAIGGIDEDLISSADLAPKTVQKRISPIKWIPVAAAILLIAALGAAILPGLLKSDDPEDLSPYINESVNTGTGDIETTSASPHVSSPDAAESFNTMDAALANELGKGGGWTFFNREYIDITYDIAYLGHLYNGEIELIDPAKLTEWVNDVFLRKSVEEQNALPTMYQAIRDLGITKEKLIEVNDSRRALGDEMILSDKYIETLYLEESEMKKALINPLALCLDGKIYTWEEIKRIGADKFDGKVMEEYLDRVKFYCISNGLISERVFDDYMNAKDK